MKNAKGAEVPLYIITVVFNLRIREIRSLRAFRSLQERHPLVCLVIADNSTEGDILRENRREAGLFGKDRARQGDGFLYIECGGNKGLSRAYNLALKEILSAEDVAVCGRLAGVGDCRRSGAWVMLADEDTDFSGEYLENVCRMTERLQGRDNLSILCGVVETEKGWISPRSRRTAACAASFLLKRPSPGIYRELCPVNSGLCIRLSALERIGGFDERLFLDQVDFLTMDRLRYIGIDRAGVLPGRILQSFQAEHPDPEKTLRRWRIFRRDFRTYCTITGKPWYYRTYLLMRRRLAIAARIRDLRR